MAYQEKINLRTTTLGEGFTIKRALPNKKQRMIGAWCFLDHAGPISFQPGQAMHVGPHPHIGLQTFTWMIQGEVLHQDSLGYEQIISPGQVNLMTAGNGITHAENTLDEQSGVLHLAQLWIALPEKQRQMPPKFEHYTHLPIIQQNGFTITLLVGSLLKKISPVHVYTPLIAADLMCTEESVFNFPLNPNFEYGVLILAGEATIDGELFSKEHLLYLSTGHQHIHLQAKNARVLIIGGEPFTEDRIIWWNFVAPTQAEIETAVHQWKTGQHFQTVPNAQGQPLPVPELAGIKLKSNLNH
ncbi:pirin family protein [Neisseria sp. Ec49-e6-T10]|uniref:pirin family protein n=1 Tax=Neisseria sp. Ec49-e6-T10 TaxID=3140744 RepID=UPI003EBF2216